MDTLYFITGATGLIGFRVLVDALKAGHAVRFAMRASESPEKVLSNPAIQSLPAVVRSRLTHIVIPEYTDPAAFSAALRGVTHVLHIGSPVPAPGVDPKTQIFEPTVAGVRNLLAAALATPSVRRVVITSSLVANMAPMPDPGVVATAAARVPPPDPLPETFQSPLEAYALAKMVAVKEADEFVAEKKPHFTVSRVVPGWVFGRNDMCLDTWSMREANSSNNFLVMGLLGDEVPVPIHTGAAHIDDVAEVHLRVAALDPPEDRDFGVAANVDFSTFNDIVEKQFPDEVRRGVFKRGKIPPLPVSFDCSETEKVLGIKFKPFEKAVTDVAEQYLELLAKERPEQK